MKSCFDEAKAKVLSESKSDESRKGSWDESTKDFMIRLNEHPDLLTLSSCSGRIVVLREKLHSENGKITKKGCEWILVRHDLLQDGELWNTISGNPGTGIVTLKFEPFILHIQCRTLELAKRMHTQSLESGFKNTGLTIGKREKFVLAVRSTHGLEMPLTDDTGKILVSEEFCEFVTKLANEKMKTNTEKHTKLAENCEKLF